MVTLSVGDRKMELPESWADIKLGDYEKWFQREPKTSAEQVHYIADVCNMDVDFLLNSPTPVYNVVFDVVKFVFEENTYTPQHKLTINNQDFHIALSDELTLAEWVDIESVFETDSQHKLSDILSILCRPIGELYDSKRSSERKDLFCALNMDKAFPLLAFFLLQKERSQAVSNLYSELRDQASQYLQFIRSFRANGDGTKSLPIWQRIRFYNLTKSLEKQLSKYSGSSFIG